MGTVNDEIAGRPRREGINWFDFLTWDTALPFIGFVLAWSFIRFEGLDEEVGLLIYVFLVPLGVCFARAGLGSRPLEAARERGVARWRDIVHQVMFAAGLVTLFFFEIGSGVAAAVYMEHRKIPDGMEYLLVAALCVCGFYLLLMWGARRVLVENRGARENEIDSERFIGID